LVSGNLAGACGWALNGKDSSNRLKAKLQAPQHADHARLQCVRYNSTGPVIIYFGLGYVPAARWFKIGFLISLFHLGIWLGIGLPYWKWLGWW